MKLAEFLKLEKKDLVGKIICFPTDTVYGVGALFNDVDAIKKIYQMKDRNWHKPLPILGANLNDIFPFITNINDETKKIMEKYWPGALTIIFNKNPHAKIEINKEFSTIGFRIPNSKIALEILSKYGLMATTSVNLSGEPPLNTYEEIVKHFGDKIDYIIEDEENHSNVSSTIVDATSDKYVILRQGDIIIKEIK